MKRGLLILALGVVGSVVAYCCVYLMGTTKPHAIVAVALPN